jgi:hypothetical protein
MKPDQPLRPRRFLLNALCAVPFLLASPGADAAGSADAKSAPAAEAAKMPDYPRVNLSARYEVVPDWGQRPAEAEAAAVPAIALDRDGNVWIYTRANPVVQIYAPDGRYLRGWREENPGTVPHGLKFDAEGNVWLVDCGLHVARKYSPEGKLLLTLGTVGERGEDERHFWAPTDITFTPNGDIFVADGYGNGRIVHFDSAGRYLKAWGTLGTALGQFSIVHAIASDSKGRIYAADRNNVRVQIFDATGKLLDTWANVLVPWGFWVSPKDEIWICGSSPMPWLSDPKYPGAPLGCPPKDQLFMKFNTDGKVLEHWTLPKGADGQEKPGEVNWLHTIAIDAAGNVYAGDIIGKRIQKFVRRQG